MKVAEFGFAKTGTIHIPQAQVEGRAEAFLEPELCSEGAFAAAFRSLTLYYALLESGFRRRSRAAVLDLISVPIDQPRQS